MRRGSSAWKRLLLKYDPNLNCHFMFDFYARFQASFHSLNEFTVTLSNRGYGSKVWSLSQCAVAAAFLQRDGRTFPSHGRNRSRVVSAPSKLSLRRGIVDVGPRSEHRSARATSSPLINLLFLVSACLQRPRECPRVHPSPRYIYLPLLLLLLLS